jgi:hypothetical protein
MKDTEKGVRIILAVVQAGANDQDAYFRRSGRDPTLLAARGGYPGIPLLKSLTVTEVFSIDSLDHINLLIAY